MNEPERHESIDCRNAIKVLKFSRRETSLFLECDRRKQKQYLDDLNYMNYVYSQPLPKFLDLVREYRNRHIIDVFRVDATCDR